MLCKKQTRMGLVPGPVPVLVASEFAEKLDLFPKIKCMGPVGSIIMGKSIHVYNRRKSIQLRIIQTLSTR